MPAETKTLYLIDGHAQIYRAYHAIRGGMSSPVTQEPTNATFGFTGMMLKLFRQQKPAYVAMVIDKVGDRETFRSILDEQYKANREAPPEDFRPQLERICQIVKLWDIPVLAEDGVEADDVIATVVDKLKDRDDVRIRIVSKDKDLQQLLGERVEMFDIHTDTRLDVEGLRKEKGVTPAQVIDVLALMGDSVDNIPGVEGVGPKTAAKWIAQYGSIENLLQHLDDLTPNQRAKVEAGRDRLDLNRKLVALKRDVPVKFELDDAKVESPDAAALRAVFKQLGFNRHLTELEQLYGAVSGGEASGPPPRPPEVAATTPAEESFAEGLFGESSESPQTPRVRTDVARAEASNYTAITTAAQLKELVQAIRAHAKAGGVLSVDTETTSLVPMQAKLCGISLAWEAEKGVYIPVRSPDPASHLDEHAVVEAMRPILEDASIPKVGQNLKFDLLILRQAGIELRGIAFDTMIASYLIDPTRSSHGLDNLALAHLNHEMIPISHLIGSGKKQITFDKVPLDRAMVYSAEDADVTLRLRDVFGPQLKLMGLHKLFDELEMPLVEVLAELEYNGILVDPDELDRQREAMAGRIEELRNQIIETAGVAFSPDSPKQLADVLFDTLGCKSYRRGKTGRSTDSEVLQRIVDEQTGAGARVAELILEYRQLTKLVSTYLVAFKDAIDPGTHRVHASFNQTVAATGRLSSSDPNLQNIPIRTEIGRRIRKAFIAPPECVLLSADYSQIELRLLAHLSQDPALIEAFKNDLDIHRAVAAEVFGVDLKNVTDEQRGAAKMVNFGIVYGITPYGLARRLSPGAGQAEVERAKQIINSYKSRYAKINDFMDRCVHTAQTKGYVETIMKRRRPIPQISSARGNIKALGERMAINTVVQGSAADLIKLAMVKLQRRIRDERHLCKMLVQIHDEILFEPKGSALQDARDIVSHEMSTAMELSVPLKVNLSWGKSWFDCK